MEIRKSIETDKSEIEVVHIQAFGEKEGSEIAMLVSDLLALSGYLIFEIH